MILIYIFIGGLNINIGIMVDFYFNIDSRFFILEIGYF